MWAIDRLRKERNKKEDCDESIKFCVGCGQYKHPITKGLWGEFLCSDDCVEIYQDYLLEIN